jgi:hypothetical protein
MAVKVYTRRLDEQHFIIRKLDLQSLLTVARQVSPIEVEELQDDLPTKGLMRLAESSGAFDFLLDEREDIYSISDLKVRYK